MSTATMKRFEVGLKGHKCQVYEDAEGRHSLEVVAPVSEYKPLAKATIVVNALSEGDAKDVFCKLQGIQSTTAEWTVRECSADVQATPIKPAPKDAPKAETPKAPKGSKSPDAPKAETPKAPEAGK